jgi:hypothetical protein
MKYFIKDLAGVKIKISSSNKISLEIIKELNFREIEKDESIDLIVNIFEKEKINYSPSTFSAKGSMNFNKTEFFVDYISEVNYKIKNLFTDETTELDISCSKQNIKKLLLQIYHMDKTSIEKNAILSYSLLWYVMHILLLKKNKAFIHSGIFSNNYNNGNIIIGTGGCGKTSTLFKILEGDYNYIAEDFGIISSSSITYYNPKAISIYDTDMQYGQSILSELYKNFNFFNKLKWNIKKHIFRRNPMIKISPSLVMKEKVSYQSQVKNVLYFVRNNDKVITIQDIGLNDLCERSLDASMRELKTLNEIILLIRANAPISYNIPSFEEIRQRTKDIYLQAFKQTNNKIVYIPHKTKPDELVDFLKNEGLI